MSTKSYKHIAIVWLCILAILPQTKAQQSENEVTDPSAMELFKTSNLWFNTSNAAGLNTTSSLDYTDVSAGYKLTDGDFRRRQDGKKKEGFIFDSEGATTLKGAYLWGKFSLETENKNDVRFNTSIIDPFRGMPYIKADSIAAQWRMQYYNMEMKVATPQLFDRLYAGLGVRYNLATGAKELDPRPLNRYYSLELTPSVVWTIDATNSIGATFYYRNHHETSSLNSKYNDYKTIYILEGLGAFTTTSVISGNRDYRGNTTGFEVQYGLRSGETELLLSGGYQYDYENVIDGIRKLINTSKTLTDYYYAKTELVLNTEGIMHKLSAGLSYNDMSGIFYDKKKDPDNTSDQIILDKRTRSTFKNMQWKAAYDIFGKKGIGYLWNAGASINYLSQEDRYSLPQPNVDASYQNIHRYDFGLHGKYNWDKSIPFDGKLLIGLGMVYSIADNCDLYYGGQDKGHIVIRDLLEADHLFLSTNYFKLAFNGQYTVPLYISNKKINAYGKASADFIPRVNNARRGNLMFAIGFML